MSAKVPCPKHASTKYGRARYVALCKECVALNTGMDLNDLLDAQIDGRADRAQAANDRATARNRKATP